jgi:hypothetical protein
MSLSNRELEKYDSPEQFWSWFASAAASTRFPPPHDFIEAVHSRLLRVHEGLAFQIGQNEQGLVIEISADGNRELISVVTEVCAAAPAVAGWSVQAFRQPAGAFSIGIGPNRYTVDDIYFVLERAGAETHIALFIAGYDDAPDPIGTAAYLLLEATLGELVLLTEVSTVAIFDRDQCPDDARPLSQLPVALDN